MPRLATLLLVLAPLAACSRPGPPVAADAPGAEEYAVWSAALDAAFGEGHPWFVVTDATHELAVETLAGVARLRAAPGPPRALLEDYIARNGHPARVHAARLHPRRVGLLPALGGPVGRLAEVASDGQVTLSRAGFDRGGNRAMVLVIYECGAMCGRGARLILERGADGRWRRTRTVMYFKA